MRCHPNILFKSFFARRKITETPEINFFYSENGIIPKSKEEKILQNRHNQALEDIYKNDVVNLPITV